MSSPAIVWLRDDLRLADNPALRAAVDRHEPVVVLFLLDDDSPEVRAHGAASRWWLHHSLAALADAIERKGGQLVLRRGAAEKVVPALVKETKAGAVYWNRRYGRAREIDARLKESLRGDGVEVESFQANLLVEPWTITTDQGQPFKVFTPFWRTASEADMREPVATPRTIDSVPHVKSDRLDSWELLPVKPDWAATWSDAWEVGEAAAHRSLEHFVERKLARYHERNEPAHDVTSRLSPHLRFGELSPNQVWHRLHGELTPSQRRDASLFLTELGWREFNWSILYAHPDLSSVNYRRDFDGFPWLDPADHSAELEAWQRGRTGFPMVDAGMRELWQTGYMHNRVRMVTASFLVKNLLLDWRIGEQWFWDCLVDADEANNPGNWQWTAGSGADAAPYFRVFNPELQAEKFDPKREYISRWVPEVGGDDYASPIVDLKQTRQRALDAFAKVRERQH